MTEITVFLAAWFGAITGVLTTALPIAWIAKKKLRNYNPMKNMFGGFNNE